MLDLIDQFPNHFEQLEHAVEEENAVEFCRRWKEERQWCLRNNLSIEEFKEEIKYRDLVIKFMFYEKNMIV
jgi:hypothetical protein